MSSASTTTNYGLPIYGANDIPKWDDTNTPFGNIDSALKGVVDDLTASDDLKFKFTKSGTSYGYLDVNGNFVPFKSPTGNKSITIDTVGTTSDIDVSDYATVSVTTDGLSKPSGNKSITISSTGTTSNIDVADYATASVSTSGLSPTPSGTKYIYSNGSYDVTNYSSAYVSVSPTPIVPSNVEFTTFSGSSSNQTMNLQTGHIYLVWFDRQALVVFNYYGEIARRPGYTYGSLSISGGVATMKFSASFCVVDMY